MISLNFIGLDMTYNQQIPYMDINNYHISNSGWRKYYNDLHACILVIHYQTYWSPSPVQSCGKLHMKHLPLLKVLDKL